MSYEVSLELEGITVFLLGYDTEKQFLEEHASSKRSCWKLDRLGEPMNFLRPV